MREAKRVGWQEKKGMEGFARGISQNWAEKGQKLSGARGVGGARMGCAPGQWGLRRLELATFQL